MKPLKFISIATLILLAAVGGAIAGPPPQADYVILNADNIDDVSLITELAHDSIRDMFMSSDGRLASTGYDSTSRIWDIDPNSEIFGEELLAVTMEAPVCGDKCYLTSVGLSENNLVVGSINGVTWVLDATTGDHLSVHEIHTGDWVNDIAFSADGSYVYTVGDNGSLGAGSLDPFFGEILDDTHTPLHNIAVQSSDSLLAYAGGDYLSAAPDTRIRVVEFDPETSSSTTVYELEGHERPIAPLEFSPDGQLLISGGGDEFTENPTIRLWDMETGDPLATLTLETDYDAGIAYPQAIAFSPDGDIIAVALFAGQTLVFETQDLVGDLILDDLDYVGLPFGAGELAFTPDGKFLVNSTYNDVIQIWGVEMGE